MAAIKEEINYPTDKGCAYRDITRQKVPLFVACPTFLCSFETFSFSLLLSLVLGFLVKQAMQKSHPCTMQEPPDAVQILGQEDSLGQEGSPGGGHN